MEDRLAEYNPLMRANARLIFHRPDDIDRVLKLVLMCRTKKVKHDLHRIESSQRNLNKKSIPLAHGTVPKSRKLKCLKLTTLIAL